MSDMQMENSDGGINRNHDRFDMKFIIKEGIRDPQVQAWTNNWILDKSTFYEIEKNLWGIHGAVVRQLMKTNLRKYKLVKKKCQMGPWLHMTEAQRKCLGSRYKFMSHWCIDYFVANRSVISPRERV